MPGRPQEAPRQSLAAKLGRSYANGILHLREAITHPTSHKFTRRDARDAAFAGVTTTIGVVGTAAGIGELVFNHGTHNANVVKPPVKIEGSPTPTPLTFQQLLEQQIQIEGGEANVGLDFKPAARVETNVKVTVLDLIAPGAPLQERDVLLNKWSGQAYISDPLTNTPIEATVYEYVKTDKVEGNKGQRTELISHPDKTEAGKIVGLYAEVHNVPDDDYGNPQPPVAIIDATKWR